MQNSLVILQKSTEYWTNAITNNLSNSMVLWSKVIGLLEPHSPSATSKLTADDFANHFRNKVDTIRNATQKVACGRDPTTCDAGS